MLGQRDRSADAGGRRSGAGGGQLGGGAGGQAQDLGAGGMTQMGTGRRGMGQTVHGLSPWVVASVVARPTVAVVEGTVAARSGDPAAQRRGDAGRP